jgi:hypothetical protein
MTDSNFAKLRDLLLNEFSETEVATLCQDIGVNYERLPGAGLFGKTRGLLEVAQKTGKLRALQLRLRELRPDGYAAREIGVISDISATQAAASGSVSRETTEVTGSTGAGPRIQVLPAIAVGIVALTLIAGLFWSRSAGSSAATVVVDATQTAAAVAAANAATPTAPAVIAVENAPAAGPTATADIAAEPAQTANPDQVVVISTAAVPVDTAPTIAVISTRAISTTTGGPVAVNGSGSGSGESHPAAVAFKDLNAMLPQFYRGEITSAALQQDWRGKAYQDLIAFSDRQLPRALQLGAAPRDTMEISYEYVKPPTVIKSSGNQHTVLSREYWRYGNQAAGITRCDTRDYTYTVVADGGQFIVTDFSSKIIENGCKP